MRFKKGEFQMIVMFLLSPFVSIPMILIQLRNNRDKYIPLLISVLLGLLSYLYIPLITNDKAEYFKNYFYYSDISFQALNAHLVYLKRPDFIFYYIIYLFSKFKIDFNLFFFSITTITVYSFLFFAKKVVAASAKNFTYSIPTISILMLGFSLQGLFSGIRFIFAGCIFIWGLYYLYWDKKLIRAFICLLLAIFTHFSFSFFIPTLIFISFFSKRINMKITLLISMIFLFLPRESLTSLLDLFILPENYNFKKEGYLSLEMEATSNAIILSHLRKLWIYFGYIFLFFTDRGSKKKIYLVMMSFLIFLNLTFSAPLIFNRFSSFIGLIFVTYLIFLFQSGKIKSIYFRIFFLLFFLSTFIDIYIMRPSFIESFRIENVITFVNIFSRQISPSEFL